MDIKYNVNNFIMKAMTILYQIMYLNLLFMVFSLPVITIGASSKALVGCIRDLFQGELHQESKTFLMYFKKDFRKSTVSFIMLVITYGLIVFNFINVEKTGWLMGVIQIPVLIQVLMIHAMISYVLLEWELPLMKSMKVAWILGNKNIMKVIGFSFVSYMLLKLSLRIPLILFFFYVSLVAILQYVFCYKMIRSSKGEQA